MKKILVGFLALVSLSSFAHVEIDPVMYIETSLERAAGYFRAARNLSKQLENTSAKELKKNLKEYKDKVNLLIMNEREACTLLGYAYGTSSSNSVKVAGEELIATLNPAMFYCGKDHLQNADGYKETPRDGAINSISEALTKLSIHL